MVVAIDGKVIINGKFMQWGTGIFKIKLIP